MSFYVYQKNPLSALCPSLVFSSHTASAHFIWGSARQIVFRWNLHSLSYLVKASQSNPIAALVNLRLCLLVYGRVMSAGNFDKKSAIFVKIATLLLGITTLFNFFVSHSFLEKYVTGGLTALTFLLSLCLLLLSKQNT